MLVGNEDATAAREIRDLAELQTQLDSLPVQEGRPLPGLELERGNGQQLSVAVDKTRLALVATQLEPAFEQYVTSEPVTDASGDALVDVLFDSVTPVPLKWFVPRDAALSAIDYWMRTGERGGPVSWVGEA
jgi:hypothetical protein